MALPSQWFDKRRGLATGPSRPLPPLSPLVADPSLYGLCQGIATSGSGLIGGVMALLVRVMIVRIGPRNTLLVVAGIHGVRL